MFLVLGKEDLEVQAETELRLLMVILECKAETAVTGPYTFFMNLIHSKHNERRHYDRNH